MEKILVGYDCLKCFVSQIDKVLLNLDVNGTDKKRFFLSALNFLSKIEDFNCSPPEIARQLYAYLYKLLGNNNPFESIKKDTNKLAEKVLNEIISKNKNLTLEDFVKFTVAGNVIDFGVGSVKSDYNFKQLVETLCNFSLEINDYKIFEEQLNNCKKMLYILDNSGEAVFDKHLLDIINENYNHIEIFIAARNENIINDISVPDAYELGFDKVGNIISTGYNGPGVLIEKASEVFLKIYNSAEIIISKGQGNFETLWGEDKNIFYALKIKCKHVADISGFKLNSHLFILGKNYD